MRVGLLTLFLLLGCTVVYLSGQQPAPSNSLPPSPPKFALAIHPETATHTAKYGETNVVLKFSVTNISEGTVQVDTVTTSCGCSLAKLPSTPWRLLPGEDGEITVDVDIRGKRGVLFKTAVIYGSMGYKTLGMRVEIPTFQDGKIPEGVDERTRNMSIALANRQAVFQHDCAQCHATPTHGKTGEALYQTACAICHDSPQRATMVPDLSQLQKPMNKDYWKSWIAYGKSNSLMPAFRQGEGGPLTEDQINNLAEYLVGRFPAAKKNVRVFDVK